ncbi:cytochrome b-c1 complex subunit 8-like [Carcharodon carcharias]|uniref:cytochrome b-c1 complex subunit 8-like n=1 Tax=Carcharodon carcharias TaxID=13397 RepID=UPI001B7DE22B|nr:cytochrome b-c1 complex subunit 8-like [Carcharodon carcharias]
MPTCHLCSRAKLSQICTKRVSKQQERSCHHLSRSQGDGKNLGFSGSKFGHHFRNLIKLQHIITYTISPFKQKAFANYFSKDIPNTWRRFKGQVFQIVPPFVALYLIYTWGNHEHELSMRKNPADFANDKWTVVYGGDHF